MTTNAALWQELRPGDEQRLWVQSQTTYAVLHKEENNLWEPRVQKQKIWVEGISYELQEIYGAVQPLWPTEL